MKDKSNKEIKFKEMEYYTLKIIRPSIVDHGSMANTTALAPLAISIGSKEMWTRRI